MHTTATKIFFGTLFVFVPIKALAESPSKESPTQADWEFDRIQQFDRLTTDYGDRKSIEQPVIFESLPTSLTIESEANYFQVQDSSNDNFLATSAAFQAGKTSWQGKTKIGSMNPQLFNIDYIGK